MEAHLTAWGWAIAAADAVLTVVFVLFGASLVRQARRRRRAPDYDPKLGRFRWWLACAFLALAVFFGWITLAWATLVRFHEPTQAVLLWICAVLAVGALAYWRRTPAHEAGPDWTGKDRRVKERRKDWPPKAGG